MQMSTKGTTHLPEKILTSKTEAEILSEKSYSGVPHSKACYAVEYKRCRTSNPAEITKTGNGWMAPMAQR